MDKIVHHQRNMQRSSTVKRDGKPSITGSRRSGSGLFTWAASA